MIKEKNFLELGSLCTKIGSGITPKGGESVYVDKGTSLIRSQNVYNSFFTENGLAYITDEIAENMASVTVFEGDVLLNITGDSVARCCLAPKPFLPARVNQHVMILRPKRDILDSAFLSYYLTSPRMQSILLSLAGSGGTRKALTKAMLERLLIPSLTLEEQRKIASMLSTCDELIENNRRRIQLLEQTAWLIYEEWFIRFRFPGHEKVRIVDGLPEGWKKKQLGEIITLKYGKALKAEDRFDGKIPVYGSSGIVGYHNQAIVKGPSIIVGRKGNVGSIYWSQLDFYPIDTVYYIDTSHANRFLYYSLKNLVFHSSDSAVPGLNRDYAHRQSLIYPQESIIYHFEEITKILFEQILHLENYNQKLTQARDLLLPKLMNGEIQV